MASPGDALLYRLGPVPSEWRLPKSEIPKRPEIKQQLTYISPITGEVSRFDRDFSGPVGSHGFGVPMGFAPPNGAFTPSETRGSSRAGAGGPPQQFGPPRPIESVYEEGSLLIDCRPGQIFFRRKGRETTRDYLSQNRTIFTVDLIDNQRAGVIRASERPHPKEALLSIVLGRVIPDGLNFKPGGVKHGLSLEVWKEGGLPRIILKRRPDDGRLVEAALMTPGRKSVSSLWRVKEWEGGHPSKVVCINFGSDGCGLSSQTLYSLAEASPSQTRTPNDIFERNLKILDQRVPLESGSAEISYPWQGQLLDAAALRRLDREKEAPLPGWMKGPQAAVNGALSLAAACAALFLAVYLSRRFGPPRK